MSAAHDYTAVCVDGPMRGQVVTVHSKSSAAPTFNAARPALPSFNLFVADAWVVPTVEHVVYRWVDNSVGDGIEVKVWSCDFFEVLVPS